MPASGIMYAGWAFPCKKGLLKWSSEISEISLSHKDVTALKSYTCLTAGVRLMQAPLTWDLPMCSDPLLE